MGRLTVVMWAVSVLVGEMEKFLDNTGWSVPLCCTRVYDDGINSIVSLSKFDKRPDIRRVDALS